MEFIEALAFTRYLPQYLNDEQYRKLQEQLGRDPAAGDLMPGTGGFRKMCWPDERRGKGRRGGLRIIYYYFASDQQIWFMTLYSKDEATDLTPDQKKALRNAIEAELKTRESRRQKKGRRTR